MRGPPAQSLRGGAKPPPSQEAVTDTFSMPAPYGGWNARGNLANMAQTDAIVMDNFYPSVQTVQLRPGCADWKTGFASNIQSLMAWQGTTATKIFASTSAGIFDATTSGVVGAAVATCTNGQWESVNFATAGGSFLVLANGVDNIKEYDGTTWVTITGVSVPAITGVATTSLIFVAPHKTRLWFVEKDSMNLWYLPVDSIGGAAVVFPVGSRFPKGGKVVAVGTWSYDGGAGPDDLFVIITSKGEIAVYQGSDPASSTTWALVGIFRVGVPIGRKPFIKYGGDLLVLSENGLVPMSRILATPIVDQSAASSYKIDGALLESTTLYAANFGWQTTIFPLANLLLINIPITANSISYQYVMNTITRAWARFLGWNATAFLTVGSELYFAGGTKTSKAWTGTSDAGVPITGRVAQAYTSIGSNGQKEIVLVRPSVSSNGANNACLALDADFKAFLGETQVPLGTTPSGSVWGTALWGTGIWGAGLAPFESKWVTVPGNLGYLHSFRLQLTTSTASFSWTATNFAFRRAGIL